MQPHRLQVRIKTQATNSAPVQQDPLRTLPVERRRSGRNQIDAPSLSVFSEDLRSQNTTGSSALVRSNQQHVGWPQSKNEAPLESRYIMLGF